MQTRKGNFISQKSKVKSQKSVHDTPSAIKSMSNKQISIQERSKKFAVRVIKAYVQINKNSHFNDAAAVLSKQFLRSGTSIGANCAEGKSAQSTQTKSKVKNQKSKVITILYAR